MCPEFAAATAVSTDAGHRYLGDAVETRYRLPRLWARVLAGEVPVWKARTIAQTTLSLPFEGAAFVDRHVAPIAGKVSFAQLERTVEEARTRFDPDAAEQRRRDAAESRHFDIHTDQVSYDGTIHLDAELDLADALDLDTAIAQVAEQLAALGCAESLDVRRAMAAGHLARHQLTLDLNPPDTTEPTAKTVKPRQVIIYVHLSDLALSNDGIGRCENTRTPISVDQVRDWCHNPDTQVTIRPVIDLNADLHTEAYTPTEAMREQVWATFPTCVFPRCSRRSRSCDLDHIEEYADGGPTTTQNLAPLCRRHHRLKTHSAWTYHRTGPLSFLWTSPLGIDYPVDLTDLVDPFRRT